MEFEIIKLMIDAGFSNLKEMAASIKESYFTLSDYSSNRRKATLKSIKRICEKLNKDYKNYIKV